MQELRGKIKLTFRRDPVEVAGDFIPSSSLVVHLLCDSLLPQPRVLSELSVSPKLGSNRFASVFWDI